MTLVALTLTFALVANLLRGTDPFAFVNLSWRWPVLPFLCAAAQLLNGLVRLPLHTTITVGTQLIIVGWLIAQIGHQQDRIAGAPRGLRTLLGGAALNAIPIVWYGAMPVSTQALAAIGVSADRNVAHGQLGKHLLMKNYGTVGWLGDILPIPYPVVRSVISLGDIAMAVGIASLVLNRRGTPCIEPALADGSIHHV
jgi:hypothetical protein